VRNAISKWTHGEDWRTWIAHAVIAFILTVVLSPFLGIDTSAAVAIGYYTIRELEQVLYRAVNREKFTPVDHLMDVLVPAVAVLPLTSLG